MSVVEGHVQFHLNLGSGPLTLRSSKRYNDGDWHRLEAAREAKKAIIKVGG